MRKLKDVFPKLRVGMVVRFNDGGVWYNEIITLKNDTRFETSSKVMCVNIDSDDPIEIIETPITQTSNSANNPMITNFVKRLLDADIRKMIKAGLLDDSLNLTAEGKNALDSLVYESHKADLVILADEIIAERKEK